MLESKYEQLCRLLESIGSCLVAYSGGVDSTFLAYVASKVLGERALAVIADTPSLPRAELVQAIEIARKYGINVRVLRTREFDNPEYLSNPPNRCYYCKKELFRQMVDIAKREGFAALIYGENADDVGDYRPGAEAAKEYGVLAPLKEVGLKKEEIRILSARFGLPTADKAEMACLSSRVPYGEPINPQKLHMIEEAETFIRSIGFRDVRVRHHETKAGPLARIELGQNELDRLCEKGLRSRISERLIQVGYRFVTVDLVGYRRGSLNVALANKTTPD